MLIYNICNPENRRCDGYTLAAESEGHTVVALSWESILSQDGMKSIPPNQNLRLDSPGENFAVWKFIVQWGLRSLELTALTQANISRIENLSEDRGAWHYNKEWRLGWQAALTQLDRYCTIHNINIIGNTAKEISTCYHKDQCRSILENNSVPIPPGFNAQNYDDFNNQRIALKWNQVFIKSLSNSSASGVAAIRWSPKNEPVAYTTFEDVTENPQKPWHCSLKLSRYREPHVRYIIESLLGEGAVVERWIPKIGYDNKSCDIRWYVCAGDAQHAVVRGSSGPITNLHLGNQRMNLEGFIKHVGKDAWKASQESAIQACKAIGIQSAGVDVMIDIHRRPWVLDVNAFGDLLPGIISHNRNTWQEQVHQFT